GQRAAGREGGDREPEQGDPAVGGGGRLGLLDQLLDRPYGPAGAAPRPEGPQLLAGGGAAVGGDQQAALGGGLQRPPGQGAGRDQGPDVEGLQPVQRRRPGRGQPDRAEAPEREALASALPLARVHLPDGLETPAGGQRRGPVDRRGGRHVDLAAVAGGQVVAQDAVQ